MMNNMPNTQNPANEDRNPALASAPYLESNPVQAVHSLMRLSRKIIDVAQSESQTLAMDDMIGFHAVQDEKDRLAYDYQQASQEFHARLNEFRSIDPALIAQLDKLQEEIGTLSRSNNDAIKRIKDKATKKTQTTLYEAQALAQNVQVKFSDTPSHPKNDNVDAHTMTNKGA